MASLREAQKAVLERKAQEKREKEAAVVAAEAAQEQQQEDVSVVNGSDAVEQYMSAHECIQKIRAISTSGICAYDFGPSLLWIDGGTFGVQRMRYEVPNSKAPLFELQKRVRELHEGLEHERATLAALYAGLRRFEAEEATNPTLVRDMYDDFHNTTARVFGKAIVETYDPFEEANLREIVQFRRFNARTMSDRMVDFVHDVVDVFGNHDVIEACVTVNECVAQLVAIGFIATFHYSVLVRSYYMSIFVRILHKAFQLIQDPICPNAATLLYASVQADEKKRDLLINKCSVPDAPTPNNIETSAWLRNMETYHIKMCVLRFDCLLRHKVIDEGDV